MAADVELLGTGGESIGEVLVFVTDGYLSRLEVCTWDEPPLTLTHAHRSLCPCDR
ncbi:hypothetical protein [Streptomyces sp. NPDC048111]|uniref:hypothetical protein n=1 Tax=Streptomyces sp. NPDC048111 TaxID=3365500 RepID=UPI00371024BB